MAQELTEGEQDIRRKARRRLVGAVALTLAVVVILPMVLEREPKPSGNDIELRIPDPNRAGEFVPPEPAGDNGVTPAVPAATVPAAAPTPASAVSAAGASVQHSAPTPQKPVAPASAAQTAPAHPAVEQKHEDKSGTDGVAVQVGAYSNASAARHEVAQLKKWGFKAYTEKSGDNIRVRVGPYADRDKAEKVLHQLEKHGLKPVIVGAK